MRMVSSILKICEYLDSRGFTRYIYCPYFLPGYATSNARYIILVEDAIAPDDVQLLKSRENELKILMVSDINSS